MGFFREIATPLIQRGIPVIPLKSHSKDAFLTSWEAQATADSTQIEAWDQQFPDANVASVAKAAINGFWFLEIDGPAGERLEHETGQYIPATFRVRSSPGRGHFYWKQNTRSLSMGNIAQGYVKNKDWSARVHNQYVVGPGSWHPKSGKQYEIVSDSPIVEAPDWLVDWLISQKTQLQTAVVESKVPSLKIKEGSRNVSLTSLAGKLYRDGLNEDEVYLVLSRENQENYEPPLDDREVRTIAHSIAGTGRTRKSELESNFEAQIEARAVAAQQPQQQPQEFAEPEIDNSQNLPYPKFPTEVMYGTSVYEGLAKPWMEKSFYYPELVFMPAVVMMLNAVFGQVHIKATNIRPNLFLGVVCPFGDYYKSSSCEAAHDYFGRMEKAQVFRPGVTKTADGKIVIVTGAGSTEGFGKAIYKLYPNHDQIAHAVLYYDELSKATGKLNIENASFLSDILSFYDSKGFGNTIKATKDSFSFEAGTYCFSWMWCTTDRKFPQLWSAIPGDHSDLDNRMFFLLSPKTPPVISGRQTIPDTSEGEKVTKQRIEEAIKHKVYDYDVLSGIDDLLKHLHDARDRTLLQTLSLYFAVDLGREWIDDDCVDRAFKLVKYRQQTHAYLDPVQAQDPIGKLMKQIVKEVRRNEGKMKERELYRNLDGTGWGPKWDQAMTTLVRQEVILIQKAVRGRGQNQKPGMIYLLKQD